MFVGEQRNSAANKATGADAMTNTHFALLMTAILGAFNFVVQKRNKKNVRPTEEVPP
jgi:hypothetical protein